jgi:hypothetical protein
MIEQNQLDRNALKEAAANKIKLRVFAIEEVSLRIAMVFSL